MGTFHHVAAEMAIGSVVAIVVLAMIGHFLELHVPGRHHGTASMVAKVLAVVLFFIFGFSLIPLMLQLFLALQGGLGNTDVGMVRFLRDHERGVVFTIWGLITTGLLIALPVMWTDLFGFNKPLKSQGLIVSNVGMTFAETLARSTFPIPQVTRESLTGSNMSVCQGVFDFEVADTGLRFEKCRYCCLETEHNDDPKIVYINTGISSHRMTRGKMGPENAAIISRLRAAGWSPGHYENTDTEQITRHVGKREGDGRYWGRGNVLLILSEKRMDDPHPNEDSKTAGEFIHVIDVLPRNDLSYQKLIFEPASSAQKTA